MGQSDGGGSIPVKIIPPPPPPMMMMLNIGFGILAATLGFAGFSLWAGVAATLSVVFGLWGFANRSTVEIPTAMLDAGGNLKVTDRPANVPADRQSPQ
jgi:hypothetical protein